MQNCVLRMPAYRQISSFIWRSNHMLYSSAVSMHLAADLHFCGRHMGGNHFNNVRCLILHLTFRKNCCIIFAVYTMMLRPVDTAFKQSSHF